MLEKHITFMEHALVGYHAILTKALPRTPTVGGLAAWSNSRSVRIADIKMQHHVQTFNGLLNLIIDKPLFETHIQCPNLQKMLVSVSNAEETGRTIEEACES